MSRDTFFVDSFETSIGTLTTAATETELISIALPNCTREEIFARLRQAIPSPPIRSGNDLSRESRRQLIAFIKGDLQEFDLPYSFDSCTAFEQAVLRIVATIPYGETRSYGDVARSAGSARAYRAVGSANARNPLPLLIPCHRVVAARGLGGYAGGLPLKRKLLNLEQSKTLMSKPHA